jgi:hypothetical protein
MKNNTNERSADDPLEARLREANDHLPDNGFTARVMAALPPRRRPVRTRRLILSVATLLGASLTAWWMPSANDMLEAVSIGNGPFKLQYWFALLPVFTAGISLFWGMLAIAREE